MPQQIVNSTICSTASLGWEQSDNQIPALLELCEGTSGIAERRIFHMTNDHLMLGNNLNSINVFLERPEPALLIEQLHSMYNYIYIRRTNDVINIVSTNPLLEHNISIVSFSYGFVTHWI